MGIRNVCRQMAHDHGYAKSLNELRIVGTPMVLVIPVYHAATVQTILRSTHPTFEFRILRLR